MWIRPRLWRPSPEGRDRPRAANGPNVRTDQGPLRAGEDGTPGAGFGKKRPGARSSHAIDTVDSVLRENSRGQKFEGSAKTPPDRDGNGGGEEWREP